jgi:N-acetyl sugar amidotransferase
MDTSDPSIKFDSKGVCDYCNNFKKNIFPQWQTDTAGEKKLLKIAEGIRLEGKGKDFDCIIGLSGGLDSSYCTYITKEIMGLRPLLFHVDAGWNTDHAVKNIEKLVDGLGLDLYTEVINWEEMKDLQVSFLKAQIPDVDLPQDIAFFSTLYQFARKNGIKYVITGGNYSTECCKEPEEWGGYGCIDKLLITDIHSKYGEKPLKSFPVVDVFKSRILYKLFYGFRVLNPLNFVPFVKADAENKLNQLFGWEKFTHKHHESRFTRFYEDYWLPRKFGFEKRRAHFSSLIMTGQMTREDAITRISKPELDEHFLKQEFRYVANKLGLSVEELEQIFGGTNRTYKDYKNNRKMIDFGANIFRFLGLEKRSFR